MNHPLRTAIPASRMQLVKEDHEIIPRVCLARSLQGVEDHTQETGCTASGRGDLTRIGLERSEDVFPAPSPFMCNCNCDSRAFGSSEHNPMQQRQLEKAAKS